MLDPVEQKLKFRIIKQNKQNKYKLNMF